MSKRYSVWKVYPTLIPILRALANRKYKSRVILSVINRRGMELGQEKWKEILMGPLRAAANNKNIVLVQQLEEGLTSEPSDQEIDRWVKEDALIQETLEKILGR